MTRWIKRIVLIGLILSIGYSLIGEYFFRKATETKSLQKTSRLDIEIAAERIDTSWYNHQKKERFTISSEFGYKLQAILLYASDSSQKTIVVHHGLGADKYIMHKLAPMYLNMGFNVLLFDSRAHGESGGESYSYGYYEKFDLDRVLTYVNKRFANGIIGVHGESMGAATCLLHAGMKDKQAEADFYISDCGYSDLKTLFRHRLKEDFKLPNLFIIEAASMATKLHEGYWFSQVSPIENLDQVSTPILFIHGTQDDYVPTFMARQMFQKKAGTKDLYLSEESVHATSFGDHPVEYQKAVEDFLLSIAYIW
ncbi:MAG: alpha/beta hydrolase [Bacteroidota bacterium]|nr:MAG: alpha/beta hydrolase [Bacteroidota bacterium]